MKLVVVSLLLTITVSLPSAFAADVLTGRAFVIDGDTIEIKDQRIRIFLALMRPSLRNGAGRVAGYIHVVSMRPVRSQSELAASP